MLGTPKKYFQSQATVGFLTERECIIFIDKISYPISMSIFFFWIPDLWVITLPHGKIVYIIWRLQKLKLSETVDKFSQILPINTGKNVSAFCSLCIYFTSLYKGRSNLNMMSLNFFKLFIHRSLLSWLSSDGMRSSAFFAHWNCIGLLKCWTPSEEAAWFEKKTFLKIGRIRSLQCLEKSVLL